MLMVVRAVPGRRHLTILVQVLAVDESAEPAKRELRSDKGAGEEQAERCRFRQRRRIRNSCLLLISLQLFLQAEAVTRVLTSKAHLWLLTVVDIHDEADMPKSHYAKGRRPSDVVLGRLRVPKPD